MSTERWQRLDQVFADAQEQPPRARIEFVERTCGADHELRVEVLSLLEAADDSGEFLASTALDRLATEFTAGGWSLRAGERVGAYVVERLLGSGGSGEVWRARDVRIGRDVAIKVLLPHFAQDAERLRRFADEARTAGALNHSNILAVYDVGEHQGAPFLVSECLEGESLRTRLDAGPIGQGEAVVVALGIARGLAAAHARGVVHRDLKPDNVFLRSDGGVKILDFGVAKLQMPVDPLSMAGSHTVTGAIIGTAGYMAPEQVRGENVDARTDLFALGATLYEMLHGQRAFRGASTVETLHAILTTEVPDLASVHPGLSPTLATIVTRLLKKAPEARFQSAADLAWALEQVTQVPAGVDAPQTTVGDSTAARRRRWFRWVAAPALATVLLAGGWWVLREGTREPGVMRQAHFTWSLPAGMALDSAPVVSPDSQRIAFVGADASGSQLLVRDLASLNAVTVPGSEGAKQPFWSPDSKSLGFFARGKLMKVALASGAPVAIADAPDGRGGAWSASGTIVFGPDLIASSLGKVSADGGRVEAASLLDLTQGENSHRWPTFLPDGIHYLYFVRSTIDARRGVYVGSVDAPATVPGVPLFQSESPAVYVPASGRGPGDLLSVRNGNVEARSFDAQRLALVGDARTLDIQAGGPTPYHTAMLSASTGVLAYVSSAMPFGMRQGSVLRNGEDLQLQPETEPQNWPRLSPDGHWLARARIDGRKGNSDIWVEDLGRRTRVRVTTAPEADVLPVWSPDGTRLAYLVSGNPTDAQSPTTLTIAARDGTGVIRTLRCPDVYCAPTDWSPDGRYLVVNVRGARGADVWMVPTDGSERAQPLLAEKYTERDARLSPDGRWISYVSDESGRSEVSVRQISGAATRIVISGSGGDQPVWRRDGTELFFVDPQGRLHSVSVRLMAGKTPIFGLPVALDIPAVGFGHFGTQYDVSPDGRRVYFMRRNEDRPPRDINVVMEWRALLK